MDQLEALRALEDIRDAAERSLDPAFARCDPVSALRFIRHAAHQACEAIYTSLEAEAHAAGNCDQLAHRGPTENPS